MTTHKNGHTEGNGSGKFEGNIQATQVLIPSRKLRVLKISQAAFVTLYLLVGESTSRNQSDSAAH
jgi:hypothetical protein